MPLGIPVLPGCGIGSAPSSHGLVPLLPPGARRADASARDVSRGIAAAALAGNSYRERGGAQRVPHRCAALLGSARTPQHPRAPRPRSTADRGTLPYPEAIPRPGILPDLSTPPDLGTIPDSLSWDLLGPRAISGPPRRWTSPDPGAPPVHPGTSALPDPSSPGHCRTPQSLLTSAPRLPPASGHPRIPRHPRISAPRDPPGPGDLPESRDPSDLSAPSPHPTTAHDRPPWDPADPGASPPLHPGTIPGVLLSSHSPRASHCRSPVPPAHYGPGPDYNSRQPPDPPPPPASSRRFPPPRSRHGAVRAGGAARAAPGLLPAALPARPLRPLAQLRRR